MFVALRGTRLELPVLVAAFYGFRRSEVLGLKWDAIDFERNTISVKRTVTTISTDGKQRDIEQQSAKTKSSLRTLALVGSFRDYFLQVKEAQELNKQVCGNCYNYGYDGFIFVDEMGDMKGNYLTNAFPKFFGAARAAPDALSRSSPQLCQPTACKRRPLKAHSGMAWAQRFYHHGEYLRTSGLPL